MSFIKFSKNLLCLLGISYNLHMNLSPESLILDIPGFAKDVIRGMVDWVWKTARCGTEKVVPLLLLPHPVAVLFTGAQRHNDEPKFQL